MRTQTSSSPLNATKGILIILIALGHNSIITGAAPNLWKILYYFHVWAFLLLPFIQSPPPFSSTFIVDRSIRYLIPYTVFFFLCAAIFHAIESDSRGVGESVAASLVAVFIASAYTLDEACGFQLFWFLPALFSLVALRSAMTRGGKAPYVLLIALVALHPVIGALPASLKKYTPFGLLIVIYIIPLGLATEAIWKRSRSSNQLKVTLYSSTLAIASCILAVESGLHVNLATLQLYDYRTLPALIVTDVIAVSASLAIISMGPILAKFKLLGALGSASLVIYLVHSLFFQAFLRISKALGIAASTTPEKVALGIALLALTLGASWCVWQAFRWLPKLEKLVFPRGLSDLQTASSLRH